MNETETVLGLAVLGQREQIRARALLAAEPWRAPPRPVRRRPRKADAPECDLCYRDRRPRPYPCAS